MKELSDIRLTDTWELTQATDGEAPVCRALACFLQGLALEAVTYPGDLFYDPGYGWGLQDFIQLEDDELVRMEIAQRAEEGLEAHEEIVPESIDVQVGFTGDVFLLSSSFSFYEDGSSHNLDVSINPVNVEVVRLD